MSTSGKSWLSAHQLIKSVLTDRLAINTMNKADSDGEKASGIKNHGRKSADPACRHSPPLAGRWPWSWKTPGSCCSRGVRMHAKHTRAVDFPWSWVLPASDLTRLPGRGDFPSSTWANLKPQRWWLDEISNPTYLGSPSPPKGAVGRIFSMLRIPYACQAYQREESSDQIPARFWRRESSKFPSIAQF
jgi:hypothetical protein